MQIPFIAPATVASALEATKSQQASPTQKATNPEVPSAQELASAMHSLTAPASQQSQLAPGMSMDQLNSMLQTSLKMQAINNDPSIPPEVKQKLLAPLLKANKDAVSVADVRAEQEEKAKIIEASSEDAQAIREAGEEIAASVEENATSPTAPEALTAPAGTSEVSAGSQATESTTASSPAYSTAAATGVGTNVDAHA